MKKNEEMNDVESMPAEETPEIKKSAESKKTSKSEKMVSFKIPKGRNEQDRADVFVCVNGVSYQIQRGVIVKLPESVVEVLENAELQMDYAIQIQEESVEQAIRTNN